MTASISARNRSRRVLRFLAAYSSSEKLACTGWLQSNIPIRIAPPAPVERKRGRQINQCFPRIFNLAPKLLESLLLTRGHAVASSGVDLMPPKRLVQGVQPNLNATGCVVAHNDGTPPRCSSAIQTARLRTSGKTCLTCS